MTLKYLTSDGVDFKEVYATRPKTSETSGLVAAVDPGTATLQLATGEGGCRPRRGTFPKERPCKSTATRRPKRGRWRLVDLRPQDRVTVSHVTSEEGRIVVRSITVLRTLTSAAPSSRGTRSRDG